MKRILGLTTVPVLFVAGCSTGAPQPRPSKPPPIAITANVECVDGSDYIGLWATYTGLPNHGWWVTDKTEITPSKVEVRTNVEHGRAVRFNIGCGGTLKNWRTNNSTPFFVPPTVPFAIVCQPPKEGKFGTCITR